MHSMNLLQALQRVVFWNTDRMTRLQKTLLSVENIAGVILTSRDRCRRRRFSQAARQRGIGGWCMRSRELSW